MKQLFSSRFVLFFLSGLRQVVGHLDELEVMFALMSGHSRMIPVHPRRGWIPVRSLRA